MNLSVAEIEALQELVNIGVGRAAGVLNEMIGSRIRLQIPFIKIFSLESLKQELQQNLNGDRLSAVKLGFTGSVAGTAQLIFPTDSASTLVSLLTSEIPGTPDLDSVKIGTLTEVGNIVLNGVMCSVSNVLEQRLKYTLPIYREGYVENLLTAEDSVAKTTVLLAQTHFTIEQLPITGDIILLFQVGSLDALLTAIELTFGGVP